MVKFICKRAVQLAYMHFLECYTIPSPVSVAWNAFNGLRKTFDVV